PERLGCGRQIGPYACCSCICGDAEELLTGLPPRSVDMVICDGPYGVGAAAWDRRVPYHLLDPFLRIATGPVLWFAAAPAIVEACAAFNPKPSRILIWAPSFTLSHVVANGLAYRFHALYTWRLPRKHRGPKWDVLTTRTEVGNWWRHKCTKPLALMKDLCGFAPDSRVVLDSFAGTGTTLLAANLSGRHFLGFEVNPHNCEVIRHRMNPNTGEAHAFIAAERQKKSRQIRL